MVYNIFIKNLYDKRKNQLANIFEHFIFFTKMIINFFLNNLLTNVLRIPINQTQNLKNVNIQIPFIIIRRGVSYALNGLVKL